MLRLKLIHVTKRGPRSQYMKSFLTCQFLTWPFMDKTTFSLTHRGRDKMASTFNIILKWISLNENVWILIKMSLNFVCRRPINNIPALVEVMAWCRPGDKPLSEPMMVRLPTHIWVTQPQWLKISRKVFIWNIWLHGIIWINIQINSWMHLIFAHRVKPENK